MKRRLEKILQRRRDFLAPSLSVAYAEPLKIVRGEGAYLFDEEDHAYLDLVNNVCHVGHCHPRVIEAMHSQMRQLNTNTRYLHDTILDCAERLTAALPDPLEVCFFVCSGSEANELALRLARAHTGRRDVVVVEGAYHGNTGALVEMSPYKFNAPGGPGQVEWVHVAPMPDDYRGSYRRESSDSGKRYAAETASTIRAVPRDRSPSGPVRVVDGRASIIAGRQAWPSIEYRTISFMLTRYLSTCQSDNCPS